MRGTTPAQRAVLDVLERERDHRLTAQEVHRRAEQHRPGIGLATVYRTLSRLAATGIVDVVSSEARENAYRLCSAGHHHHLICRDCGTVIEIADCEIEAVERALARRYRFRIDEHSLTFRGRCRDCAKGAR